MSNSLPPVPIVESSNGAFMSILNTLQVENQQMLLVKCDKLLAQMQAAMNATGKGGSINIKVSFMPWGEEGDVPQYILKGSVEPTFPKKDVKGQTYFLDERNQLTRQGRHQTALPLEMIPQQNTQFPPAYPAPVTAKP